MSHVSRLQIDEFPGVVLPRTPPGYFLAPYPHLIAHYYRNSQHNYIATQIPTPATAATANTHPFVPSPELDPSLALSTNLHS